MTEHQATKNVSALSQFEGSWKGTTKVWFEPDKLEDESPTQGTIRQGINKNSIFHEYEAAFKGKALKGFAIYAQNGEEFQAAWIDGFHMSAGILFSQGTGIKNGFQVLGSYGAPGVPDKWGWRTELQMADENKLIITMYNISPQGEEAKAVETILTRV